MAKKMHVPALPNLTKTPPQEDALSLKSLGLAQPKPFGHLRSADTKVATWRAGEGPSNTHRGQGPEGGNGLSSGLKRLYSDMGEAMSGGGGEAPGPRCTIPLRTNRPATTVTLSRALASE